MKTFLLILAIAVAMFSTPVLAAHAATPGPALHAATLPLPAEIADFVDGLRLPRPTEVDDLVRKLGKLVRKLGKVLGLDFAVKVSACAIASNSVPEFRRCLRVLLELEVARP